MSVKKMKTDDLPRTESLPLWLTTAVKGDAVIYCTGAIVDGKTRKIAGNLYSDGKITLTRERTSRFEKCFDDENGARLLPVMNYIAVKL
jgi:hypothetical protein